MTFLRQKWKKIFFALTVSAGVAQLWQPLVYEQTKQSQMNQLPNDHLIMTQAPPKVASLLQASCYDCHSAQVNIPWYGYITPVNIWLAHHRDEAREHLDFSRWGLMTEEEKNHACDEVIESLQESTMPLESYTWMHAESMLSAQDKFILIGWFQGGHGRRGFPTELQNPTKD